MLYSSLPADILGCVEKPDADIQRWGEMGQCYPLYHCHLVKVVAVFNIWVFF